MVDQVFEDGRWYYDLGSNLSGVFSTNSALWNAIRMEFPSYLYEGNKDDSTPVDMAGLSCKSNGLSCKFILKQK